MLIRQVVQGVGTKASPAIQENPLVCKARVPVLRKPLWHGRKAVLAHQTCGAANSDKPVHFAPHFVSAQATSCCSAQCFPANFPANVEEYAEQIRAKYMQFSILAAPHHIGPIREGSCSDVCCGFVKEAHSAGRPPAARRHPQYAQSAGRLAPSWPAASPLPVRGSRLWAAKQVLASPSVLEV